MIDNATDATPTAVTHAEAHNNVADAILALEMALGINPSGSYASVAAALIDALKKTPTAQQVISPSADVVPVIIKLGSNLYIANQFEIHDHLDNILAYVDHSGVLNAQGLKVGGSAISASTLSDGKTIQKKSQIESFMRVPGVTPGLSGNPQTALQVSANASWNLSIAAGSALIQGTDNTSQGMYAITQGATYTLALGTHAPSLNPRIDAIVVQYNDSEYTARTPGDSFSFLQVVGTPTVGATLTNLSGAPAIPASSLLLGYILVSPSDAGVQASNVLDQRKLEGPAVWGEDGHRYRVAVNASGQLYLGQVI